MTVVGCTGGIGAGKSVVASLLAGHGALVLDADDLSRQATAPDGAAVAGILERFGTAVVTEDGSLNRAALAAIVFSDVQSLRDLEALVHPVVDAAIVAAIAVAPADAIVVVDSPLLVETGGRERYGLEGLLVVDAPEDIALDRLVQYRNMDVDAARARIAAQTTRAERLRAADFIIMNMGTLDELAEMTSRAWHWILGLARPS